MESITKGCDVAGCDKPLKRKGYCYGHYMKAWRYGDPLHVPPQKYVDIAGRRYGGLTVSRRVDHRWLCVCDCGNESLVTYFNLTRGNSTTCGLPGGCLFRMDHVSYGAAHARVRTLKGRAAENDCVDCGDRAAHWSYDHKDADEVIGRAGQHGSGLRYSLDPERYEPRCVPCHKAFDMAEP